MWNILQKLRKYLNKKQDNVNHMEVVRVSQKQQGPDSDSQQNMPLIGAKQDRKYDKSFPS